MLIPNTAWLYSLEEHWWNILYANAGKNAFKNQNKKAPEESEALKIKLFRCRGDRIRTCDTLLPKQVRYRTALHPVSSDASRMKIKPQARPYSHTLGIKRAAKVQKKYFRTNSPRLPVPLWGRHQSGTPTKAPDSKPGAPA